jgi:O-antigen ligase
MSIDAVTALLAWGVLAFGAVYPWGFGPLAAVILVMAAWQWRPRASWRFTGVAAALVVGAVALQLVPLPTALLRVVSPGADGVLSSLNVAFANGIAATHPLSIDPERTRRALGAIVLGILWVSTCSAMLKQPSALRALARNLAVLGTLVAVVGLAQKATFNGKMLWFWTPEFFAYNGFGPFVNRNHFAGWMLLALTVSVGLLFASLRRSALPPGAGLRDRVLWIGSPAAAPALLLFAAALVMACSLVWTMSRSGIASTAVALVIMATAAVSRAEGSRQRWLIAAYVAVAAVGVVAWRGTGALFDWYGNTSTLQWRVQLWKDSLPALQDFWLTGSGLNTYATLLLVHPRTDLTVMPRAAHNDYLQLALEGGLLVVVPVIILAGALVREGVRALRAPQDGTTWWIRMGAVAGLCGMAVQEISEFSLQVPGAALLFATCVAIAVHPPAPLQARRSTRSQAHHHRPAHDRPDDALAVAR